MKHFRKAFIFASLLSCGAVAAENLKITHKQQLTLPRIIGGVEAPKGEFPWMASVQWQGQHFCGGSVIADEWILTAAHCVEDETANNLQVRVNFTDLNNTAQGESHQVQEIFVKQAYLDGQSQDIALLKLATKVSSAVAPITLADENIMLAAGKPGSVATVSGWGNQSTITDDFPNMLQKVQVPLVSNEVCNSAGAYGGQVQNTEMCAGLAQGGKDSCQGDSGGPIVIRQNGDYVQAGIVSWGDGCAQPNKYGVYARVASFNEWIADVKAGKIDQHNPGGGNTGGGDTSGPVTMTYSGDLITNLSGKTDENAYYEIEVAEGTRLLWIDTKGGTGDVDLYLRHAEKPTIEVFDYSPFLEGNSEYVVVELPAAGTWHIMLNAYTDYAGVELMIFTR